MSSLCQTFHQVFECMFKFCGSSCTSRRQQSDFSPGGGWDSFISEEVSVSPAHSDFSFSTVLQAQSRSSRRSAAVVYCSPTGQIRTRTTAMHVDECVCQRRGAWTGGAQVIHSCRELIGWREMSGNVRQLQMSAKTHQVMTPVSVS